MGTANNLGKVKYIDTAKAYDLWSNTYDTDGNFLQALDTIEMKTLLPRMLNAIDKKKPWRIVDLGCGTGRNTAALLQLEDTKVTGLDLSQGMLAVADARLEIEREKLAIDRTYHLDVFDMLTAISIPDSAKHADAIISTLVVEHVPLHKYFETTANMLNPGGLLLLTNMHPDMGKISQAGFTDLVTGDKIRPNSFCHTIDDTIMEARNHGFEVLGDLQQRAVDADMVSNLGPRAKKWIGINVWFGGILKKAP